MRKGKGIRRMTSFRLLVGGLAAIVVAPAIADACVQTPERAAFNVRALQSQLMVAALACGKDGEYNAFVRKFQRDLAASYNGIQGHYRRTGGRSAQNQLDGYITQLANAQSQDGIRAGSHYCPLVTPLFQHALAQQNGAELAQMAEERNVLNPLAEPACSETQATTPARAPTNRNRNRRPANQRTASR
jgi:hypothetical protein